MIEIEMIAIAISIIPDHYKERAFRYIAKLLPSSLSKPRYTELLKKQSEERLLSVDESRQLNVCKVCQRASEILGEDASDPPTADNPYEDDWLSTFENESCHKSSKDMQERFARMLAGEIKRPGSFSIRTIKLLGQIDTETASAFRLFCSGCVSFDKPSGSGLVYTSIFPKFEVGRLRTFLNRYGIGHNMLSTLQGFSLLETEMQPFTMQETVLDIQECFIGNSETPPTPFLYAGKYFFLRHHDDKKDLDWDFHFPGYFLSSLGNELIRIVEPEPIKQLTEDIKAFFAKKQLELVEVELTDDKHWKPKL